MLIRIKNKIFLVIFSVLFLGFYSFNTNAFSIGELFGFNSKNFEISEELLKSIENVKKENKNNNKQLYENLDDEQKEVYAIIEDFYNCFIFMDYEKAFSYISTDLIKNFNLDMLDNSSFSYDSIKENKDIFEKYLNLSKEFRYQINSLDHEDNSIIADISINLLDVDGYLMYLMRETNVLGDLQNIETEDYIKFIYNLCNNAFEDNKISYIDYDFKFKFEKNNDKWYIISFESDLFNTDNLNNTNSANIHDFNIDDDTNEDIYIEDYSVE